MVSGSATCVVRTRIPTVFGTDVYVHLYHNTLDSKEHLALVFGSGIRSTSLDAIVPGESDTDRLIRGASVAEPEKATSGPSIHPSHSSFLPTLTKPLSAGSSPPLVRIHSECFTGETIHSVRCDCGDQLDNAMRLIADRHEGVILYLRQEGRGLGLVDKLRAYNMQDQGHDTVNANLLLNRPVDMRSYDVAALILNDLNIPSVRLLTNNPDKIEQLSSHGIRVLDRLAMVPSHWSAKPSIPHGLEFFLGSGHKHSLLPTSVTSDHVHQISDSELSDHSSSDVSINAQSSPARSDEFPVSGRFPEMDAYLHTKVNRMRHMLDLSESPKPQPSLQLKPPADLIHSDKLAILALPKPIASADV